MAKSRNTILGILLCGLLALCLTFGIMGFVTSQTAYAVGTEHDHSTWTVWGGGTDHNSMPSEAGSYYLTNDITLSGTWNVPTGTTNLCLNGYVIKLADDSTGNVIKVLQNATLNLYDCDTTKSHNGYVDANGLWHLDATNAHNGQNDEKDITGGIITGGNNQETNSNGGGVQVDKGVFNMYGGNIVGNFAKNGAGVQVSSATEGVIASFNMSGGTISYNNAMNGGGGVSISNKNVVFNMTGGEITNNVVNSNFGGGVIAQSDITLGGTAKITGNTANGATNNVYLYGKTITLGTDGNVPTTMNVGITLNAGTGKFTANGTADYSSNFFSDNENYGVSFNNNGTDSDTTDDYLELKTVYAITNNATEDDKETNHGYITVENNAVEGEVVVVTVVPNSGYELLSLKYNDGTDNHDITPTDNVYSFSMPAKAVSITATFVVGKQTISISEIPYSCTYNGEPRAFQITSGEGPMLTGFKFEYYVDGAWIETAPTNAGSYNVKITREEDDTYKAYEKEIENGLVIEKAEVVAPTIASKTYTGSPLTANVEESAYDLYEITENNGGTNADDYDVKLTLTDSDNYKWTETENAEITLTFTISPKEITLEIDDVVAGTYTYDGQAKTTTATCTGLVGEDELTYTLLYSDNINAGTCGVSIASASITKGIATNYCIKTTDTDTFEIDKAPLTITANDKTIIYNQEPANDGVSYDGFVNDETSAVLGGTLTFEYSYEKGNNAGEYTITPSGLTSNNYEITFKSGTLTVAKAEQVIEINDISKTYDTSSIYFNVGTTCTRLGDGEVTVEFKLVSDDDDKYTVVAPTNVGYYVVRVSVLEGTNYLAGSKTQDFEISYYYINQVGFGNIEQPVAQNTAPTSSGGMLVNTKYHETLTWSPSLVEGKFNYNTVYTATVALEIEDALKENCKFAEEVTLKGAGTGWTKSTDSTDTKLIYTKTFNATEITHSLTEVPYQPATCTEDGYKAAYYCSECGKYFTDCSGEDEIGDSTAYDAWKLNEGKLIATHIASKIAGVDPTTERSGYKESWKCSECNRYFEDENCTKLIGDETAYNSWKENDGYLPQLSSHNKVFNAGEIFGLVVCSLLLLLIILYLIGYFFLYRKGKLDDKKIRVIYKGLPRGNKNLKEDEKTKIAENDQNTEI